MRAGQYDPCISLQGFKTASKTGELGILLNKYLRNSLYPLLENPGHTLVDIRAFLINKSFRNRLLQQVKIGRNQSSAPPIKRL